MNKKLKPLMAFFENILYLDDYINLYISKEQKLIVSKPYKKTLKNGKIIDAQKFISSLERIKKENKIKTSLFKEKITIIINSDYNKEDKNLLKKIMNELNYTEINFINELDLLKIKKDELYIFYEQSYYRLYYLNELRKIKMLMYERNEVNNELLEMIISMLKKSKIFVAGKDTSKLGVALDKRCKFFYYEEFANLFIKLLLIVYSDVSNTKKL